MRHFLALSFLLLFCGCPEDRLKPEENPLHLTVEDVTCTEAFLKISLSASEANHGVLLKRNDSTIISDLRPLTSDTLVIDEGLLPNKTYTYKLVFGNWSATAQTTTMDTTSSNWSFTLDTLGESGSYFADVAIVNDSLAYAVGEVHIGDTVYNVAKWNGITWELQRVKVNFRGNEIVVPLEGVFTVSSTDIWFVGSLPIHGNGVNWNMFDLRSMAGFESVSLSKVWALNSSDIYFVGTQGNIVHYNGSNWQKQESGTTLSLVDIGGNNESLYLVGVNRAFARGIVLKEHDGTWEKIIEGENESTGFLPQQLFKTQLYGSTEGMWMDKTGTLFTVGNLMYRYKLNLWGYVKSLPENYIGGKSGYRGYLDDVDGNSSNDMFIAGQRGTLRHFNGTTWSQVGLPFNYNDDTHFWLNVSVKGNLAIVVGSMEGRARTIVLKR